MMFGTDIDETKPVDSLGEDRVVDVSEIVENGESSETVNDGGEIVESEETVDDGNTSDDNTTDGSNTTDDGETAEAHQKPSTSRYEVVVEQGKKPSKVRSILKNIAKDLLCVLFVCILFFVMFFNMEIPSESMEPTLQVGDRLLGWKLYLSVDRGDVVVFWSDEEGMYLIKRVIGLPGETVSLKDGYVYIDGEKLEESWLPEDVVGKTLNSTGGLDFDYGKVPENCYFLLGDNRKYSYDCRFFSNRFINSKEIKAKAIFRYYPFDRFSFGIK